mgnify:CR=1 FL=1
MALSTTCAGCTHILGSGFCVLGVEEDKHRTSILVWVISELFLLALVVFAVSERERELGDRPEAEKGLLVK